MHRTNVRYTCGAFGYKFYICIIKIPQTCSQIYLRMRGDFMDFFDELEYLEAMELIDNKNNLLNELEFGVNRIREEEIYDELNIIQEKLDFLGY